VKGKQCIKNNQSCHWKWIRMPIYVYKSELCKSTTDVCSA